MELKDLRSFIFVYELGSFRGAAEALHTTQSNISARIRRLEDDFGGPLFDRLHRRIAPTRKGERAYLYARAVVQLAETGAESIRRGEAA